MCVCLGGGGGGGYSQIEGFWPKKEKDLGLKTSVFWLMRSGCTCIHTCVCIYMHMHVCIQHYHAFHSGFSLTIYFLIFLKESLQDHSPGLPVICFVSS